MTGTENRQVEVLFFILHDVPALGISGAAQELPVTPHFHGCRLAAFVAEDIRDFLRRGLRDRTPRRGGLDDILALRIAGTAKELADDEQVRRVYLGKNFELR